jgi:hypothetical protein
MQTCLRQEDTNVAAFSLIQIAVAGQKCSRELPNIEELEVTILMDTKEE